MLIAASCENLSQKMRVVVPRNVMRLVVLATILTEGVQGCGARSLGVRSVASLLPGSRLVGGTEDVGREQDVHNHEQPAHLHALSTLARRLTDAESDAGASDEESSPDEAVPDPAESPPSPDAGAEPDPPAESQPEPESQPVQQTQPTAQDDSEQEPTDLYGRFWCPLALAPGRLLSKPMAAFVKTLLACSRPASLSQPMTRLQMTGSPCSSPTNPVRQLLQLQQMQLQ